MNVSDLTTQIDFLLLQTQFLANKVFQNYLYCQNCLQMTAESMFIGLTYHALFRMYPIAWFALIVLTHNCGFSNIYHLSFLTMDMVGLSNHYTSPYCIIERCAYKWKYQIMITLGVGRLECKCTCFFIFNSQMLVTACHL